MDIGTNNINRVSHYMKVDAQHWASHNAADLYQKQQMRNGMQQQMQEKLRTLLDRDVAHRAINLAHFFAHHIK